MSTDDALEAQRRVIGVAVGDVAGSPDLSVIVDSFGHKITPQSMQTFSTFFTAGRYTVDVLPENKMGKTVAKCYGPLYPGDEKDLT
jgi:hypothetical protein